MRLNEEEPHKVMPILAQAYELPEPVVEEYLSWEGMSFENKIEGIEGFADFMMRHGYLETSYTKQEVVHEAP